MDWIRIGLALLTLFASFFWGYAIWCGLKFFRRRTGEDGAEPVSVLKPVAGPEPGLQENLASFFRQDHPKYEILFGLEPADPARAVIARLAEAHPEVPCRIVEVEGLEWPNRKSAALYLAARQASYDRIAVSDQDVRVTADYLRKITAPLAGERVGLVCGLYWATAEGHPASHLLAVGINADIPMYVIADYYLEGLTYALGASYALRREALEAIGGFPAIREYVADDYRIGNRIYWAGWRIELAPAFVEVRVRESSFREMWDHALRWARTIRTCRPMGYFLSALPMGVVWAFLYAASAKFHAVGIGVLLAVSLWRILSVALFHFLFIPSRGLWKNLWLLPLRDLVFAALWLQAWFGREVTWRGRRYRISSDGRMEPLPA